MTNSKNISRKTFFERLLEEDSHSDGISATPPFTGIFADFLQEEHEDFHSILFSASYLGEETDQPEKRTGLRADLALVLAHKAFLRLAALLYIQTEKGRMAAEVYEQPDLAGKFDLDEAESDPEKFLAVLQILIADSYKHVPEEGEDVLASDEQPQEVKKAMARIDAHNKTYIDAHNKTYVDKYYEKER